MIDYADLYGVRPGETDFSGAIERIKRKGNPIKHVDKEYLKVIQLINERRKSNKN